MKNYDVLIATTTHYDIKGFATGYDVFVLNYAPIAMFLSVLFVLIIFTILFWPKHDD